MSTNVAWEVVKNSNIPAHFAAFADHENFSRQKLLAKLAHLIDHELNSTFQRRQKRFLSKHLFISYVT